jgi:tripartite-type tricarboxylate transporter receptor subunit TctC
MDDIAAYAKDHPGELMCGGSNAISDDAILINQINNEYGIDITYVAVEASTDALTDTMGGHLQLAFGSPVEIGDNIAAGNLVPIAVAADNRVDYAGMENVPTFIELGHKINHQQHRGS